MKLKIALALTCALAQPTAASVATPPTTAQANANLAKAGPIENFDLSALADGIDDGALNSEAITAAYLARIAAVDDSGPTLNAVIATFPDALDQARAMDAELRAGKYRGPMHGIPVLVKDNVEVAGPIATTAGSLALAGNITNRDAPLIARLREAGAVILGKTNLSEWANIRSDNSTSGWSAVGGLTKNPHALDRNSCGSSSGSGAAAAAALAAGTIGTETDGSITCPAGVNGVVGFKPTVGLVSRRYVVPISHSQDTAGPMTRSVRDAAIMLTAMAGGDPQDAATAEADRWRGNYPAGLSVDALKGMRIGVIRAPNADAALFDAALAKLKDGGAEIIVLDAGKIDRQKIGQGEFKVLLSELKADLDLICKAFPTVSFRTKHWPTLSPSIKPMPTRNCNISARTRSKRRTRKRGWMTLLILKPWRLPAGLPPMRSIKCSPTIKSMSSLPKPMARHGYRHWVRATPFPGQARASCRPWPAFRI